MYDQQYAQHYAPQQPVRSAIPKVIGILMIIFASLGLFGSLIGLVNGSGGEFKHIPELKTYTTIELLFSLLGLGIGFLHLFAGVRAIGYKANAPALVSIYAVVAMFKAIVYAIVVFAWAKPIIDKMVPGAGGFLGIFLIVATLFSLAWPIVALILMNRPSAKAACVNQL